MFSILTANLKENEMTRQLPAHNQSFRVNINEFCKNWDCPNPWSEKNRPGELGWFMFRDFKKPCEGFEFQDPNNEDVCKGGVTSRYLSSEVGYHLKFHFDEEGVP